jgi:hypothetical protein
VGPRPFLLESHFRRFLIGADPRDVNRIWCAKSTTEIAATVTPFRP